MTLTQVQPLNIVAASKTRDFLREAHMPVTEVKSLQWRRDAVVALVFFVASLALAPTLTRARDQKKLASEISTPELSKPRPQSKRHRGCRSASNIERFEACHI